MAARWKFWGWGIEGTRLDAAEQQRLLDFYHTTFGSPEGERLTVPELAEIELRAPRISPPRALAAICTSEPHERLVHSYGKSLPDAIRIFARDFGHAPDLVAKPRTEADVTAVLDWAADADAAVVPFGAGSSVVGGVSAEVGDSFAGTISLDLKGLDQLLEVDPTSRAARMQGGMLGPAIETALKPHGLTLRHFPQSFEFSTLGGWIATRSGGHFATLYTHIEDFLESMRVVTPMGAIETRRLPGSGAGPSPDRLFVGSEGSLGVITEAWLRLQDRPKHRTTVSVGFASLFEAARAVRAIAQAGLYPSNLRVLDPMEAKLNGAGDGSFALLVLGFESGDHPVEPWLARGLELCADHGGRFEGGPDAGRAPPAAAAVAWRQAFIRMPYARELLMQISALNDTFETAITWDRFEVFHDRVKAATEQAIVEATGKPGVVTCRFTHVYSDGPAPYFTFHGMGRADALMVQWRHVKEKASDAVIEGGGTITHHHAVGRDHMPWYERQRPALVGTALAAAKQSVDPTGMLNPGVLFTPRSTA